MFFDFINTFLLFMLDKRNLEQLQMCTDPTALSSRLNRFQEALLVKLCTAFPDFTTKYGVPQVVWWTAQGKNNLLR